MIRYTTVNNLNSKESTKTTEANLSGDSSPQRMLLAMPRFLFFFKVVLGTI